MNFITFIRPLLNSAYKSNNNFDYILFMSKPPLPPSVQQTIDDPQSQELTSGEGGANTPSNNELAIYQTAGTQEGQKEDPEFDDDQDPTNDQNPVTKLKKRKTGALNADGVIEAIVVKKKKKKLKVLE